MRIPSSRDRDDLRNDQSMTAMIDIVFLLLIFLVCARVSQSGEAASEILMDSKLSAGAIGWREFEKQKKPLGDVWLYVRLDAQGKTEVQLGKEGIVFRQGNSKDLKSSPEYGKLIVTLKGLAASAPEIPVVLDIGPKVEMGIVLNIYNACEKAGFHNVNYAVSAGTKLPAKKPTPPKRKP